MGDSKVLYPATPNPTTTAQCMRCGQATPHELVSTATPGQLRANCLRCRELDGEAGRIIAQRQRAAEIHRRVNDPNNPAVRAEIATNLQSNRWNNRIAIVVVIVAAIILAVAGDGDPVKGLVRLWIGLAGK